MKYKKKFKPKKTEFKTKDLEIYEGDFLQYKGYLGIVEEDWNFGWILKMVDYRLLSNRYIVLNKQICKKMQIVGNKFANEINPKYVKTLEK